MDINRLYSDYSIPIAGEGTQHFRAGWVNTKCPFCVGNPGNHLGYNIQHDYFCCWRCGHKSTNQALEKLLGVSWRTAKELIRKYNGKSTQTIKKVMVKRKNFIMPKTTEIRRSPLAMNYMLQRRFSSKEIYKLSCHFGIQATTLVSSVDNMDLSYRIIAPIYSGDKIVSWQTRDITGISKLRYITCPKAREVIEHKHILYNDQGDDVVILCEGIFDVWRVYLAGYKAVCCFGVEFTPEQFQRILKYKKVFLFMDPDKAGKDHMNELVKRLTFAGTDCEIIDNPYAKDPGDLSTQAIKQLLEKYNELEEL